MAHSFPMVVAFIARAALALAEKSVDKLHQIRSASESTQHRLSMRLSSEATTRHAAAVNNGAFTSTTWVLHAKQRSLIAVGASPAGGAAVGARTAKLGRVALDRLVIASPPWTPRR